MNSMIAQHIATLPRSGIREYFDIVQSLDEVISLGVGEPDFATPWHIREAAIYALERGQTSYTSNSGTPNLREAIANYIYQNFSLTYDPECEILVSVGVSEALDLALRAIVNPQDEIIYHEPCYVSYHPGIVMAHGLPRAIVCKESDRFAISPDAIEAAISEKTRMLILNFPTNPTGGTLDSSTLEAIAEIVRQHNLIVISDEIYAELTFEGRHRSIASFEGMKERTLFLHGLSKAFAMTGFRIGYACGPRPLIEAMLRIHQYSMLCASSISQEAAREALTNGAAAVCEMREEYRLRRDFIITALNEMGLPCHCPHGSFYAFPSVRETGMSSKAFSLKLLQNEKVACVPGTAFGESGEGFLRCCFATSFEQLETAMARMDHFVKGL